jgi:hypothetical protein
VTSDAHPGLSLKQLLPACLEWLGSVVGPTICGICLLHCRSSSQGLRFGLGVVDLQPARSDTAQGSSSTELLQPFKTKLPRAGAHLKASKGGPVGFSFLPSKRSSVKSGAPIPKNGSTGRSGGAPTWSASSLIAPLSLLAQFDGTKK